VPKQLEKHGLRGKQKGQPTIRFARAALQTIAERYTKEAGVRNLEREIASICRKMARRLVAGELSREVDLTPESVIELLGVPRYHLPSEKQRSPEPGVATGLAWTETGGEILTIEATMMRGRGNLTLTGQLGEVMQESAQAALSYIRGHADALGVDPLFHRKYDLHVHIPEGAIPKDGPSAGISLATALASLLSGTPTATDLAMTGEITLRGKVLPVGGVKEKVLAAYRFGVKRVILPRDNEKDLSEIPGEIGGDLQFILVEHMDEVLAAAFATPPPGLELGRRRAQGSIGEGSTDESVAH
jgi:ATP-dependent Lon protease